MSRVTQVLELVIEALTGLEIPYVIGGSLASGVHGQPRSTHDIDILVELRPEQLVPLQRALGSEFYVDLTSMGEALARKSSFNAIHRPSAQKIDLFVSSGTDLDREQMNRRVRARIESTGPEVFVTSAEVILLRKLDWYRRGGGASERQMRDITSVLREQRGRLDEAYLDRMAREVGLDELLSRARLISK